MITPVSLVFGVDEDICKRAFGDFISLCPKSQIMVNGTDGAFGSGNRWLLTSASAAWTSLGIAQGMVLQLFPNTSIPTTTPAIPRPYALFAIDSVSSSGLSLRQVGQPLNVGMPPGPAAGVTGLTFSVVTLSQQLEESSYKIYRKYGIDPKILNRAAEQLYDPREANQLCVVMTLARQYMAMARMAGDKAGDDFAAKANAFEQESSDCAASLILHWNVLTTMGNTTNEPSTSPFSTRLSR